MVLGHRRSKIKILLRRDQENLKKTGEPRNPGDGWMEKKKLYWKSRYSVGRVQDIDDGKRTQYNR